VIPRASVFESVTQYLHPSDLESMVVAGPDPTDYLRQAQMYAQAGMDGISLVNGSAKMEEFFGFAAEHLIPAIHSLTAAA
jgi:hypothetical protein